MFSSVLVVCTGNICRSPMGEFMLRERWKKEDARVASAGVGALAGYPADEHAQAVMKENGVDIASHRAQQVTTEIIRDYDLILVMEKAHVRWFDKRAPTARGRVHLMSRWVEEDDVPDPYRRGREAFDRCYELMDRCVESWLLRL